MKGNHTVACENKGNYYPYPMFEYAEGGDMAEAKTAATQISPKELTVYASIKAVYKKGPNVAVLMENEETIYVNPGFTAVEGGYLFDSQNPQGCLSTRSASDGYHLSHEGIVFYRSQEPAVISGRIRLCVN